MVLALGAVGIAENGTQEVQVVVNGEPVGVLNLPTGWANTAAYYVTIPKDVFKKEVNPAHIKFSISDPVSPKKLGGSTDSRQLGMAVNETVLYDGTDSPPPPTMSVGSTQKRRALIVAVMFLCAALSTSYLTSVAWNYIHDTSQPWINLLTQWDSGWYAGLIRQGYMSEPLSRGNAN